MPSTAAQTPPSTSTSVPVMKDAASETRNATTAASSSAVPSRPNGVCSRSTASRAGPRPLGDPAACRSCLARSSRSAPACAPSPPRHVARVGALHTSPMNTLARGLRCSGRTLRDRIEERRIEWVVEGEFPRGVRVHDREVARHGGQAHRRGPRAGERGERLDHERGPDEVDLEDGSPRSHRRRNTGRVRDPARKEPWSAICASPATASRSETSMPNGTIWT